MNTKGLRQLILAALLLPLHGCVTTGATGIIGAVQAIGNVPGAIADTITGVTKVRREEYLEYEKYVDELNIKRETQGLQPLPKLSYNDWKKGKTASPSGGPNLTSTGT